MPPPTGPGAVPSEGAPRAELPDPETLRGLESDYREFLRPEVDEGLRRTALKKLFADPHFNVMDGLDVYIDDYSKPDPIPTALLRTMNQARGLKLFDDEESADKVDVAASQQAQAAVPPPGPDTSSPAGQLASTECPPATERPREPAQGAPDLPKTG